MKKDMVDYRDAAKNFGRRLGEIAREKGISQKELSERTGFRATTISRIFTGKFCAKSDYLFALADAVGVSIVYNTDVKITDESGNVQQF